MTNMPFRASDAGPNLDKECPDHGAYSGAVCPECASKAESEGFEGDKDYYDGIREQEKRERGTRIGRRKKR